MFGALIDLLILFSIFTLGMVAWKFWQQRADEKLRNNPPQRRIVEVSLPVGVGDSAVSMTRFYRKASTAALGDKGARKQGSRQIDFVYLVDVPAEGALPRMRCRIYADPDKMDAVKKALKSSFQEAIDLVELQEDDLLPIAQVVRPPDLPDSPEDIATDDLPEDYPRPEPPTDRGEAEDREDVEEEPEEEEKTPPAADISEALDQLLQEDSSKTDDDAPSSDVPEGETIEAESLEGALQENPSERFSEDEVSKEESDLLPGGTLPETAKKISEYHDKSKRSPKIDFVIEEEE